MGKCVHHVLTDNIYTEENQSVGEKQLVCEQGNTLSLQVSLSLCVCVCDCLCVSVCVVCLYAADIITRL